MGGRPSLRTLFGIGLVSGSTLAFQVLLTRMLSAVLFYHFMFLAISLALLGTAVGGLAVYLWPRAFSRRPLRELMAEWSLAFALLLTVSPLILVRLDYSYNNTITAGFVVSIGLACLVALLPFLAAGIVITLAIRGYTTALGQVYAFDLVGAGVGALAIVPAMTVVSAPTGMVALGALAGAAGDLRRYSGRVAAIIGCGDGGCLRGSRSVSRDADQPPGLTLFPRRDSPGRKVESPQPSAWLRASPGQGLRLRLPVLRPRLRPGADLPAGRSVPRLASAPDQLAERRPDAGRRWPRPGCRWWRWA
ncbi:MAG TPA: hypothetical protein VLL25_07850, partial [Acidimicrobiales bacterium]|nr:hypothetical protein [Acidimicrobiales bacterium]